MKTMIPAVFALALAVSWACVDAPGPAAPQLVVPEDALTTSTPLQHHRSAAFLFNPADVERIPGAKRMGDNIVADGTLIGRVGRPSSAPRFA